jgi:hypothetical protein
MFESRITFTKEYKTHPTCRNLDSAVIDKVVKSLEIVMPDLRSLPRTTMRGHPEGIEFTG